MKSTDLLVPMLRRALAAGVKARYLLMDSWFGLPAIISALSPLLPVICMVKRTPKVLYGLAGKRLTVDGIYRKLKKRRGRAKLTLNDGQNVRLAFVRDRRKKDWLTLLSTELNLPEADVVCIYGKRWDIEVFFRTAKQFLSLEKSSGQGFRLAHRARDHLLMRSIILSVNARTALPRLLRGNTGLELSGVAHAYPGTDARQDASEKLLARTPLFNGPKGAFLSKNSDIAA